MRAPSCGLLIQKDTRFFFRLMGKSQRAPLKRKPLIDLGGSKKGACEVLDHPTKKALDQITQYLRRPCSMKS